MVTQITSFGRSGLYDWMVQRVSAIVLSLYTVFILGYLVMNPELTYDQWSALFEATWMRIFTLMTLLSIGVHSWIGHGLFQLITLKQQVFVSFFNLYVV